MAKIIKGTDEIPTEETKTVVEWCIQNNIRLSDEKYYDDTNEYTAKEFDELIPKDIQLPLVTDLTTEQALDDFARGIIPEKFAKEYKKMKKLQEQMTRTENMIKNKLIEMFESTPALDKKYVAVDGLKFTYVGPSQRNTVDTKKLKEEYPEIYKKVATKSNVKSQIRTSVEY